MKKSFALLFISGLLTSCSENEIIKESISLEYDNTIYYSTFYSLGATDTPQVNWQGETGIFRLEASDTIASNVSVDSISGVIKWNNFLPLGAHSIDIEASNSQSSTIASLEINNQFSGRFQGGLSADLEPEFFPNKMFVQFNSDNKFLVESVFETVGNGNWWLDEEGTLKVTYTNSETKKKTSLFTTEIIAEESEAFIMGFWIEGEFPNEEDLEDYIEGSFKFRLISK